MPVGTGVDMKAPALGRCSAGAAEGNFYMNGSTLSRDPVHARARHLDRYYTVVDDAGQSVESLHVATTLDAQADAELRQARRALSIFRAQHQSAEGSHMLAVTLRYMDRARAADALEDDHMADVLSRQARMIAAGRAGIADCEAER